MDTPAKAMIVMVVLGSYHLSFAFVVLPEN